MDFALISEISPQFRPLAFVFRSTFLIFFPEFDRSRLDPPSFLRFLPQFRPIARIPIRFSTAEQFSLGGGFALGKKNCKNYLVFGSYSRFLLGLSRLNFALISYFPPQFRPLAFVFPLFLISYSNLDRLRLDFALFLIFYPRFDRLRLNPFVSDLIAVSRERRFRFGRNCVRITLYFALITFFIWPLAFEFRPYF